MDLGRPRGAEPLRTRVPAIAAGAVPSSLTVQGSEQLFKGALLFRALRLRLLQAHLPT